jgi:hypothetical protein
MLNWRAMSTLFLEISKLDRPFLFVTTCEEKIGFLLIGVFRNHFNPQNYGHLV